MKIALVYSGQPRNIKECFPNHVKTFIQGYISDQPAKVNIEAINPGCEIDIFAHIWYDEKWINNWFWDARPYLGKWETGIKEYIIDNWKPKGIIFCEPKEFSIPGIESDVRFSYPMNNTLSMFYSLECANKLKKDYEIEKGFQYDYVVRLRTDQLFVSPIGPLVNYERDNLHIWSRKIHLDYGIHDHFAFGSSPIMDKYSDVYSNFIELCKMGAAVNPECILGYNVQIRHKIPVQRHDWIYRVWRDMF